MLFAFVASGTLRILALGELFFIIATLVDPYGMTQGTYDKESDHLWKLLPGLMILGVCVVILPLVLARRIARWGFRPEAGKSSGDWDDGLV